MSLSSITLPANWKCADVSYPLPPACEDTEILRVVVRESLSGDLARKLLGDIVQVYVYPLTVWLKADEQNRGLAER